MVFMTKLICITVSSPQSLVLQMSMSPSGSLLASIDVSGNLTLWDLPSFRLKRKWTPQELVSDMHYNDDNYCVLYFTFLSTHSHK